MKYNLGKLVRMNIRKHVVTDSLRELANTWSDDALLPAIVKLQTRSYSIALHKLLLGMYR